MRRTSLAAAVLALLGPAAGSAYIQFGAEQLIQDGGSDLVVLGHSIPDLYDWTGDSRLDLIVGEGGGVYAGKVRIYPNLGSDAAPVYNGYFYAQYAFGGDLFVAPG